MQLSLQIGHLVKEELRHRGLISDIEKHTGLERHTVSALLHNSAKYVSLEALGKICDYLERWHGVPEAKLPGALFAKRRDGFWAMLADREEIEFCMATRSHPEWPGQSYVTTDDSHLQGVLLSHVSAQKTPAPSDQSGKEAAVRYIVDPHLITAPRRNKNADGVWETVEEGREKARNVYEAFRKRKKPSALVAIGSTKGQAVLELMLADTFSAKPFVPEDRVKSPTNRSSPVYFWYRSNDLAPVSMTGGRQLYQGTRATEPGIYYETGEGGWKCCPWEQDRHDVAFVFYAFRPNIGELMLACGGFTGVATRLLASTLVKSTKEFEEPQYKAPDLEVGFFLVTFTSKRSARGKGLAATAADFDSKVIALPESVLQRRIEKKRRRK